MFPVLKEQNNKLVGQSSNIVLFNYAALLVLLIDGRRVVKYICCKYFQKMKPLRWLLSYVVTNHLVNQAKTRITKRLSSSYTAFSTSKINEIYFIRGMARITSYCLFRGKEVSSLLFVPYQLSLHNNLEGNRVWTAKWNHQD